MSMSPGRHTAKISSDNVLSSEIYRNFTSYLNDVIESIFAKFINFINIIGTKIKV